MTLTGTLPAGISFDPRWYAEAYPDVFAAGIDPARHYEEYGREEGRLPCAEMAVIEASALLDINYYVMNSEDVRRAGLNPFVHFCRYGSAEGRRPNPYFDPIWYARTYKTSPFMGAVAHYLLIGEARGFRPSFLFDPVWYREAYAIEPGQNALAHYLAHRGSQRVSPLPWFDVAFYVEKNRGAVRPGRDAFGHYLAVGSPRDADPAPWFDARAYRATRMEGRAGDSALLHLIRTSFRVPAEPPPPPPPPPMVEADVAEEESAPPPPAAPEVAPRRALDKMELRALMRTLASPFVDAELYETALGGPRTDPATVDTYISYPPLERPSITPFLDPIWYIARYPEVRARERDPLLHFLRVGLAKSFDPHPLIDVAYLQLHHGDRFRERRADEALAALLRDPAVDPSPYFASSHYLAQVGENLEAASSPLRHYLLRGMAQGLRPNRFLDLDWYAARHKHLPQGAAASLRHFVQAGDPAGEPPGPDFDGAWYLRRYPDVSETKQAALRHYLAHGEAENRQRAPVQQSAMRAEDRHGSDPEAALALYAGIAARHDSRRAARHDARRAARQEAPAPAPAPVPAPCEPPPPSDALISIVMTGAEADAAARARALEAMCPGLRTEFIEAGEAFADAIAQCRGDYVLLLGARVTLEGHAIHHLAACLDADPRVAACGPVMLRHDGDIAEAGRAIGENGDTQWIGAGDPASLPAHHSTRAVHALAPDCVLVRRAHLIDEAHEAPAAGLVLDDAADFFLGLQARGAQVALVGAARASRGASTAAPRDEDRRVAARRAQAIAERWGETLARLNRTRVIAFYLPQYHPTPENDRWWGKGFTDWTNVARATPSFAGHYQPHVPADLGYYDLRLAAVFADQARLAARYGIDGFCVYYYRLDGRRQLDAAFEAMLHDRSIAFPFCIAWANENWTRRWDGGNGEMLAEQLYDETTIAGVIADAVRLARDPRYITVDGRPLLAIYRPKLLPDASEFAARARAAFAEAGFPGLHLVAMESMEASADGVVPSSIGFDAAVEFPPHGRNMLAADRPAVVKDGWSGTRFDYAETVLAFTSHDLPPYPRHPAVFPSWDNTPRQPLAGITYDGADPALFQFYVERKLAEVHRSALGDKRLLFVNAWNEWAEGAHLEPDLAFGHRWLEALRAARETSEVSGAGETA